MILSYRNKESEQFSLGVRVKSLENIEQVGRLKLNRLKDATTLADIANLPGNRFEKLKGDRAGQFSIRRSWIITEVVYGTDIFSSRRAYPGRAG